MNKPVTGKRQHIVPQQMIRSFAGDDGKLLEMLKPGFRIATKRRSPKEILFGDDYYRDAVSDFDAELLTPIEQKFRRVYPRVLAGQPLDGRQGAAFIDWVAAMLVRTSLMAALSLSLPEGMVGPLAKQLREAKRLHTNIQRSHWFEMYQDLFARERWLWKYRRFPQPCLVLTDNPVCTTPLLIQSGPSVVVPMSSNTLLVGGPSEALERLRDAIPSDFNFFLVAYANRHVFAASKDILEAARETVSDGSPYPEHLVAAARKPFFGAPERAYARSRSEPKSLGFDFDEAIRNQFQSFGSYRWEAPP